MSRTTICRWFSRRWRRKWRLKRAQAELGELKNAVAAGKYVLRDELEDELTELFSGIRRAALALPRRVSGLLVGHVGARRPPR